MCPRVHFIAVFACIGLGMGVPQFSLANSPHSGNDLFSAFRAGKSTAAKNEEISAMYCYRLAKTYAEQNDVDRANANFSLALQNAAPKQVAEIAADYAAFLMDTGDVRRAELLFRQTLSLSPDNTDIVRKLARCLVLQERTIEGLRYLKTIDTEAEARAEIAAIYREQGNTEMLIAVNRQWGAASPETVRPEAIRLEPALIAATPPTPMAAPRPRLATTAAEPESALIAATQRPAVAPPLPSAVRALPSVPAAAVPRVNDVLGNAVAVIAATPAAPSLFKSKLFDSKVPIPVPQAAPSPVAAQPALGKPEKLVLTNPIKLATAPKPIPSAVGTKELSRPAVTIQPRRHYVVNAGTSTDLETLFPVIRPAAIAVPANGR